MINFIVIKKSTMVATILGILSIFFLFLCINNAKNTSVFFNLSKPAEYNFENHSVKR